MVPIADANLIAPEHVAAVGCAAAVVAVAAVAVAADVDVAASIGCAIVVALPPDEAAVAVGTMPESTAAATVADAAADADVAADGRQRRRLQPDMARRAPFD